MKTEEYLFSNKDLKNLILPLIADQFLQSLVGLADSIMVSSVGEEAVSAVSLVDTVMLLLINIFTAVATGGAVIAAQYLGKNKKGMACEAAGELLRFTVKASVVITVLAYIGRNFIIQVVFGDIEPAVMRNCQIYMVIVFISIPMIAVYNAGTAIFRAMGDSAIAMKTSLMMNAVNITGNALLVYGLHRGIEGVAIPTVVSRGLACVVILYFLNIQQNAIHIPRPFRWKTDRGLLKKILYIGIPNGLENSMFQLGKILVLSVVAGFGTASIAANAVSNNIATFCLLPGMAMSYALLTVAARCIGAGKFDQAAYYTKKFMIFTYISLIAANIIVHLLLPFILKNYGLSEEARKYAYEILIFYSFCVVTIWPPSFLIPNTLRAAADVRFTMILSIISMWIFRIGFSVVLGIYLHMGVLGVWGAMAVDWLFRGICFIWRYAGGRWRRNTII